MIIGASEHQRTRKLDYPLPAGISRPPPSFYPAISKAVHVMSLAGRGTPLADFDLFVLTLFGADGWIAGYPIPALGRRSELA